jgi:hypothetical protein
VRRFIQVLTVFDSLLVHSFRLEFFSNSLYRLASHCIITLPDWLRGSSLLDSPSRKPKALVFHFPSPICSMQFSQLQG